MSEFGHALTGEESAALFAKMDLDGNGTIDFKEFSAVAANMFASSSFASASSLAVLVAKEMSGFNDSTGRRQSTELTTWAVGNNKYA